MKIENIDGIIPCYFVDWSYFGNNIQSILKEVPLKKLYIGCNNPNEKEFNAIKDYLSKYDKIQFIDQRGIKTLGFQITDLMKRCDTEFICYCHADVNPTPYSWLVLEADMNDSVGIVESERVQMDYEKKYPYPTLYPYYYYRDRAFSGYQLIRMKSIIDIVNKIEDDYVYRNEDIIFQNACNNSKFKYVKSFGMHIHTSSSVNQMWTPQGIHLPEKEARQSTYDMQVKGIVKYCTPDVITKKAWRDAFGICIKERGMTANKFIEDFVRNTNPEWESAIWEIINELMLWVYR